MKKKVLLIIVAVIVLIGGLIASYFLFFNNDDKTGKQPENGVVTGDTITTENWLRATTLSELENLSKKTDKKIEYGEEDAYVSELPFGEGTATYGYRISSDGNVLGLNIGKMIVSSTETDDTFVMEEITVQQLRERIDAVLGWVSEVLNVKIGTDYYITTDNFDMLSVEEDASYQQILDGTAVLDLRILDNDESVWILEIGKVQGYNIISCTFEHCMADSEEAQLPCYVAVE